MFAKSENVQQFEARYENEDGSISIKYLEVDEDTLEYINQMLDYIGFLQDELLREEVIPLKLDITASSPIMPN
jgi:hypothetical protein